MFHVRAEEVSVLAKPAIRWPDLLGVDPDYFQVASVEEWLEANRGEA